MMAIEYLEQVRELDGRISKKIKAAKQWREMAYRISGAPLKPRYNPNRADSAPYEKCILKAEELEKEISADIDRLADLKLEVEMQLIMIDDDMCQEILRLRYVELLMWDDIVRTVDKCRSYVFSKHREALERLDVVLEKS